MGADPGRPLPNPGSEVTTACGGQIRFEPETPYSLYRDKRVFFCLPACKKDFDQDAKSSCLAWQIALEGAP
jgi:hypothetical protein